MLISHMRSCTPTQNVRNIELNGFHQMISGIGCFEFTSKMLTLKTDLTQKIVLNRLVTVVVKVNIAVN